MVSDHRGREPGGGSQGQKIDILIVSGTVVDLAAERARQARRRQAIIDWGTILLLAAALAGMLYLG